MTTFSQNSKASSISQKILDQVSIKSSSPLFQIQALLNDNIVSDSLSAFGAYINRQMRTGRSIQVPKFGIFSFSAPMVSLNGVTNPIERDQRPREPVFLLSKQFIPGRTIKSGIFSEQGVRGVDLSGVCGSNQYTKANYIEMSTHGSFDKELIKTSLDRVFQTLAEHYLKTNYASLDIPEVGMLVIKNGIATVQFQEGLRMEVRTVLSRSMKERKDRLESNLTRKNIRNLSSEPLEKPLEVEEEAKTWLKNNLSLDVDGIFSANRNEETLRKEEEGSPNFGDPSGELINDNASNKNNEVLFESVSQRSYMKKKSIEKKRIVQKPKGPFEAAVRKIKTWLRLKNLNPNDGFFELAKAGFGRNTNIGSKFSRDILSIALEKQGMAITGIELESLFERLDINKDQLFDVKDWCEVIIEEEEVIHYIRETIKKNQILSDDLLKRMGLSREQGAITDLDVRNGLKRLMPDLSDISLSKAMRYLQSKGPLTPVKLLELFEFEDSSETFDEDYLNVMFKKLAQKDCAQVLQAEFEKFDKSNQGRLDIANFKTCLFKLKLGLGFEDINRITRYLEKDKDMMIDYVAFVLRIKKSSPHSHIQISDSELISQLASQIKLFLQKHHKTLKEFIRTLFDFRKNDKISEESISKPKILTFAQLFFPYVSVFYDSFDQFLHLAQKIDIDNDGCIDYFDLEVFLKRVNYIEVAKRPSTTAFQPISNTKSSLVLSSNDPLRRSLNTNSMNDRPSLMGKTQSLFPKIPLSEAKFDEVVRDLKKVLLDRKVSYFEMFQNLDQNEDGFLTINEFVDGIDKFLRLSQTVKEGLFAYFDTLRIGMVDYPQFLAGLKKPPNAKKKILVDNWDWQEKVVAKIRQWFSNEKITFEEAFKLADQDFDGVINKSDLEKFLLKNLKIDPEAVTSTNLDRLYKLIDSSKKGFIYKSDFKELLQEPASSAWLQNVKQQMGLYLSKNFEGLRNSFEKISKHSGRVTYKDFKAFLEESRCLMGFNLTETLLQQFYAFLDPHSKGFLTENDWENAFKNLDFEKQKLSEIIKAISFHFKTSNNFIQYFKKSPTQNSLTFVEFFAGVNGILPSRFHEADLKSVFKSLLKDPSYEFLDFETFQKVFGCSLTADSTPVKIIENKSLKLQSPLKPLENLRMKLQTSNRDFPSEILKHDPTGSGLISSIQLRNLFQDLKLGLSSREIVEVLSLFQNKEKPGFFEYPRFFRVLQKTPLEQNIGKRTKTRLEHLKHLIEDYLISAKNAFRQYNEENSGRMSYEEFEKMARSLYLKNGEEMQPFDILKDLFDFIDLRKDGVLDIHEWMQTFRSLEKNSNEKDIRSERKPILWQSTRKEKSLNVRSNELEGNSNFESGKNIAKTAINFDRSNNKTPSKLESIKSQDKSPLQYQDSKDYDDLVELIVRNRRLLQEIMEKTGNEGKITAQKALEVIKKTLKIESVPDNILRDLLRFSQKEEQLVHIRFFMEVLKDRAKSWTSPPRNFRKREGSLGKTNGAFKTMSELKTGEALV